MALTVEELQIVLSCDATTAQKVLDQMNATVKAYTQKFQSYFNKLGMDKNPKAIVGDVKAVEKQLDNVANAIEKKSAEVKKGYKDLTPKYNSTGLTYKDVSNTINQNIKNGREAAEAYTKEFAKVIADSQGKPNLRLLNLGSSLAGDLKTVYEQARRIGSVSDTMREKIFRAYSSMRDLGENYSKAVSEQGEGSSAAQKAEQAYLKAVYAVDKYVQQLGKAIAKEEEAAQKAAELDAKRRQPDPKQVRAGNQNAENNPQYGNQGEGRMQKSYRQRFLTG